jgi:hypothetical protein
LRRRKGVLWGVYLVVLVAGLAYAGLGRPDRLFRGSLEIGAVPAEEGVALIEAPGTVLAKISENFIPRVTAEFNRDRPTSPGRLELTARIPKDSALVVVEAEAPTVMGEVYISLIGRVLALLRSDHGALIDRVRSGIAARLEEARRQAGQLEEEGALLQRRLEELTSGEGSLPARISAMREQVEDARADHARLLRAGGADTAALALQSAAREVRTARASLRSLEEELRSERQRLRAAISEHRTELRDQRTRAVEIENQLSAVRETRVVLPPRELPDRVGPSGLSIVAAAGMLGLLLGILGALFAEFLEKVRSTATGAEADIGPRPLPEELRNGSKTTQTQHARPAL